MNREEAKELLPIIQAFADGKTVQYKGKCGKWINCANDSAILDISTGPSCFRIKPEPKYRPFKTQEECWDEMHKHPDFGWLYYKKNKYYVNIGVMGDYSGMNGQKFADAFNSYTFTDGEPFGVKEE